MKVQLKKFPNGAELIYNGKVCTRIGRSDRYVIVQLDNGVKLLLHPDTYVEPLTLEQNGK